jgi:hypothetical protein
LEHRVVGGHVNQNIPAREATEQRNLGDSEDFEPMFPICLLGPRKTRSIEHESAAIRRPFETNARILPKCAKSFAT